MHLLCDICKRESSLTCHKCDGCETCCVCDPSPIKE